MRHCADSRARDLPPRVSKLATIHGKAGDGGRAEEVRTGEGRAHAACSTHLSTGWDRSFTGSIALQREARSLLPVSERVRFLAKGVRGEPNTVAVGVEQASDGLVCTRTSRCSGKRRRRRNRFCPGLLVRRHNPPSRS